MSTTAIAGGTTFNLPGAGDAATFSHITQFATPINNLETGMTQWTVATGSANAFAIAPSPAVVKTAITALPAGILVVFQANFTVTGPATVAVNGVITVPLVRPDGSALASGDVVNGQIVQARFDGTSLRLLAWPQAVPSGLAAIITAIDSAISLLAPLASPTFTGTPSLPTGTTGVTQSPSNNSTKLATTAYADAADALRAPLASPTFTGTPAAPTAGAGTSTTQLATTAFVAASFQTLAGAQNQSALTAADTGSANAYAMALTPAVVAYTTNMVVILVPANNSTGASTLALNGLPSPKAITKNGTQAITANDLLVGNYYILMFDGTQFQVIGGGPVGTSNCARCEMQLTLTSGVPFPISNVASSSNIFATPCGGNVVSLFDGTVWNDRKFTEITIALSGLTAGLLYDLFAFDNAGAVTFDAPLAWTSATARATGLVRQDGVLVKSGDATRRYIGTFRAITATTTCDTNASGTVNTNGVVGRMLWNYYNRAIKTSLALNQTWTTSSLSVGVLTTTGANFIIGVVEEDLIACYTASNATNNTGGDGHFLETFINGAGSVNWEADNAGGGTASQWYRSEVPGNTISSAFALGYNFVQAAGAAVTGGTATWTNGSTVATFRG